MDTSLFNLADIKRAALESIKDGAVTKDYPLDIEKACKLLNDALATEIMCVLRYRRCQITAKGINYPQVAAEFEEHAEQEEQHMLMLAERIDQLGGTPDFSPSAVAQNSATDFGKANNLSDMIKDNLIAERIAIMVYRRLIDWFGTEDPTTRRMLEQILEDEEEHADDLANLLPMYVETIEE